MGCTAIAQGPRGLEQLVHRIQVGGVDSLSTCWEAWFSGALEQLEMDDSIEARVADGMADALAEAEEALREGLRPEQALLRLVGLFSEARVELVWRQKASSLQAEQLHSTTWDDLHKALEATTHSPALVEAWVDWAEGQFLSLWESYEAGDVLCKEVTIESILGHEFLAEGVEEWLTALAQLRESLDGPVDHASILQRAEAGQRLLMALQVIEQERRNQRLNFIAAWTN